MGRKFQIPGENGCTLEFHMDGDKVHRRILQPNAKQILKRNQELRKSEGAVKTTSFGKLELDVPVSHIPAINDAFPGAFDPTHPDHKFALRKFMKYRMSDMYRMQERKRGVNRG